MVEIGQKVTGASAEADQALAVPAEPASGLVPSGFDPSRVDWQSYVDSPPPQFETVHEWRVPNRHAEGLVVQFFAWMRERGAGYSTKVSPAFDYWDGWKLHVPAGTQWRPAEGHNDLKEYDTRGAHPVGVELEPCPFCKKVPVWKGINRTSSGTLIGAKPHEYNVWWLECCAWAKTPHLKDPRELAATRNAMIASLAQGIAARSDETLKAAQPEGQEPGAGTACAPVPTPETPDV